MTWPAGTLVVCRSGTSKDSPRSGGPQYSPLVPLGMSTGVTIESGIVTIRTERIQSLVSADIITSLYILNLYLHVFAHDLAAFEVPELSLLHMDTVVARGLGRRTFGFLWIGSRTKVPC